MENTKTKDEIEKDRKIFEEAINKTRLEIIDKYEAEENSVGKFNLLQSYLEESLFFIKGYDKIIKTVDSLKKELLNNDEKLNQIITASTAVNEGLFIKWDEKDEKFIINFEKSPYFNNEDNFENQLQKILYKRYVTQFIEDFSSKLAKYEYEYEIPKNILNIGE